jgi:hypothetical protein
MDCKDLLPQIVVATSGVSASIQSQILETYKEPTLLADKNTRLMLHSYLYRQKYTFRQRRSA